MSEEDVAKIKATMYGKLGDTGCGNCVDEDSFFKDNTKFKVPVEYSHTDIDSDAGKAFAEKHKVDDMPVTEVCKINKSGIESCENITGYDSVKKHVSKYMKE